MKNKKQPLLNTYVNNVNMTETIELIDELLEAKKKSYVLDFEDLMLFTIYCQFGGVI